MSSWEYSYLAVKYNKEKNNGILIDQFVQLMGGKKARNVNLIEVGPVDGPKWKVGNQDDFLWYEIESLIGYGVKRIFYYLNHMFIQIDIYYARVLGNSSVDAYSGYEYTFDIETLHEFRHYWDYCYGLCTANGETYNGRRELEDVGTERSTSSINTNDYSKGIEESKREELQNILEKAEERGYTELCSVISAALSNTKRIKHIFEKFYFEQSFKKNLELTHYEIPEGMTMTDASLFSGCKNLKSVVLPSTLYYLGRKCFEKCESLEEIVIPPKVIGVNKSTFSGCINLKNIELSKIREIDSEAFRNCNSLTTIKFPTTLELINKHAFKDCQNLKEIELSSSSLEIKKDAFSGCTQLETIHISEDANLLNWKIEKGALPDCLLKKYPVLHLAHLTKDIPEYWDEMDFRTKVLSIISHVQSSTLTKLYESRIPRDEVDTFLETIIQESKEMNDFQDSYLMNIVKFALLFKEDTSSEVRQKVYEFIKSCDNAQNVLKRLRQNEYIQNSDLIEWIVNKTFVLVGINKEEQMKLERTITYNEGIIKKSVAANTDFLIYKSDLKGSDKNKYKKTKELIKQGQDIDIMTVEEFLIKTENV